MLAHDVVFQVFLVFDRNAQVAVFVHDIDGGDAVKAVCMDGLPVFLYVLTTAAVCRAALDKRAVHLIHQLTDECRFQVVVAATLARTDFYCHAPFGFNAERLVDLNE